MGQIEFDHSNREGREYITLVKDGDLLDPITTDHPHFKRIVAGAYNGDEGIFDLVDIGAAIEDKFREVTERVSVANGKVFFDNDEIPDSILNRQILRSIDGRIDSLAPLVNFLERVQNNPNEHSRTMLYEWLNAADFTITLDGYIVGYKGVRKIEKDGLTVYVSINSGTAVVDGVTHNGEIPNEIGTTVTMPRSKVAHDPSNGCSYGLHVGTWAYASGFAQGATLTVHVDPRDVVSVPTDSGAQKLRCCRYKVVDIVDTPYDVPVYGATYNATPDYEEDFEGFDPWNEEEDEAPACEVEGHCWHPEEYDSYDEPSHEVCCECGEER